MPQFDPVGQQSLPGCFANGLPQDGQLACKHACMQPAEFCWELQTLIKFTRVLLSHLEVPPQFLRRSILRASSVEQLPVFLEPRVGAAQRRRPVARVPRRGCSGATAWLGCLQSLAQPLGAALSLPVGDFISTWCGGAPWDRAIYRAIYVFCYWCRCLFNTGPSASA